MFYRCSIDVLEMIDTWWTMFRLMVDRCFVDRYSIEFGGCPIDVRQMFYGYSIDIYIYGTLPLLDDKFNEIVELTVELAEL